MRLRPDLRLTLLLALMSATLPVPVIAAGEPGVQPSKAEIAHAVEKVLADPALVPERRERHLVWDFEPKPRKPRPVSNFGWLGDLFAWIAQTSSVIVWVLLAGLVALLAVLIFRIVRINRPQERARRFVAPTHVQDLDIRPESLPPDIGAAARALWDRGEQRAALALLYRGMLSRLAHVHEVPIRDSSTEGDCLTLAARRLEPARIEYITPLVRAWQRAIYGGLALETPLVWDLCARFAANLDGPAAHEASGDNAFTRGAPA